MCHQGSTIASPVCVTWASESAPLRCTKGGYRGLAMHLWLWIWRHRIPCVLVFGAPAACAEGMSPPPPHDNNAVMADDGARHTLDLVLADARCNTKG